MLPVVLLLLSQQPLEPGNRQLPPNHPPAEAAPSAGELMKKLDGMKDLADKDKSFEVAATLGRLYYAHGRYAEAVTYLGQALEKAKPARDLYAQLKKAAGNKPLPAASAAGCTPGPDDKLDAQLELAKTKGRQDPAAGAACARAALHPLIELETQLGNARFLMRDPTGALASYESALELFESNPEARYGRAALLLDSRGDDLKALEQAKGDFTRFLADYPTSPRAKQAKALLERTNAAIEAGGMSKLAAKGPNKVAEKVDPHAAQGAGMPKLTQEMIDAVQNVERTPELEAGFDKLIEEAEEALATGKYQDALDAYKRVVPFNPDNARARAGMAWSLVRLQKPMAQNVWSVALQSPESLDALGDTLQKKGDKDGAKLLWQRLKDTAPQYAPKVEGKLK
ncbi:MAG: tetratricopeptide repeat protein [Myxococcaceae bacterium]|nr:tetratricopeptide repeat protein [Myxococcaceae bacterium]